MPDLRGRPVPRWQPCTRRAARRSARDAPHRRTALQTSEPQIPLFNAEKIVRVLQERRDFKSCLRSLPQTQPARSKAAIYRLRGVRRFQTRNGLGPGKLLRASWRQLEEPRSNPRTLRQQSSLWTMRSVRCLPPFHLVPLLVLWKCKAFFNGCGKMRQLIEINCPQGCRRSATGLDRHRRSPCETAGSTGSSTCVCRTDASFRRERIPGDCAQVALADRPDGVNLGLH